MILFETEMSERTNTSSAFWCMIAEWFVLCKSPKETSSNKQYLTTSRTVKYWRGDLTNQLREFKYRHIKSIFRSDYFDQAFQNNRIFSFFSRFGWNLGGWNLGESGRSILIEWERLNADKSGWSSWIKLDGPIRNTLAWAKLGVFII